MAPTPVGSAFGVDLLFPFNDRIGLLLLALSSPHLLYLFTWTCAGAFTRIAKTLGVQAFELFYQLSVLLKFVQLAALIAFGMTELTFVKVQNMTPAQWAVGALLFGAGQVLNMSVYKALGKEGVYYGVRLGRPIAWYEGFPFTVVPHPQYVGCILCIWGVAAVLFSQAAVNAGLLTVSGVWTGYYVFTGIIEHFF